MKILGDNTPPDAWHLIAVHLFLEFQRGKCRYYRVHRFASEKEMYKSFVKMCSNYIPLPKQTKQDCSICDDKVIKTLEVSKEPTQSELPTGCSLATVKEFNTVSIVFAL